jgi:rubrerythrin
MPEVTINVGHPIFIIERSIIKEGKITRFIKRNEVMVSIDPFPWEVAGKTFTYGIDFFFTYEKARKEVLTRAENIAKKRLEQEQEARERGKVVQEEQRGKVVQEVKYYSDWSCNSCGKTIDSYGRCGCS